MVIDMYESIQIGTLLGGRYEIIEKIGTGGMAEVYKAKCRLLNRLVAVKALKGEFSGDEEFIRRFEVEAQAAASISHPNIVSVYDVGFDRGRHYIVMELVEGITLKEYITRYGALEWREALGIAAQICSALECAHKKNIIHRDIKPHNIIITKNNIAKVTDFGIARATGGSTMVADSSVMGSAHYISPEQARGGYTDAKSDIYSAGVTLYEMLTGRVPYDGDSPVSVAMMHTCGGATPPRTINPDVSEAAEQITLKAMCKEQIGRYDSAAQMLEDIDNALANKAIFAAGDDDVKTAPAGGETKRRRGGFAMGANNTSKKGKEGKTPLTKSEKRMVWMAIVAAIALIGILGGIVLLAVGGGIGGGQWDETQVPTVEGKTLEEAQKLLKDASLNAVVTEIASAQYPANTVISQDPDAGRSVKKGSSVRIEVSTGAGGIILVPNVVSYDKDAAKILLESAGFVVVVNDELNENVPENTVIRQVPVAESEAQKGETIRLYVSTKEAKIPVDVPNVIGRSLAQAKNAIEAAGLTVGNVAEQESDEAMGTVIRQSPPENSKADKGSAVALTVSAGAMSTPTPTPQINTPEPVKYKTISLPVPQNKDTTRIKVVANGQTIHDEVHSKDEVTFDLRVSGKSGAKLDIYHDGALVGSQTITFN